MLSLQKKKLTIIIYWVLKLNTIKFIKFNYIYFVYTSISFFLFLFLDPSRSNNTRENYITLRPYKLTYSVHKEADTHTSQAFREQQVFKAGRSDIL